MIYPFLAQIMWFAQAYGRGNYGSNRYQDIAPGGNTWLPNILPATGGPSGYLFSFSLALLLSAIVLAVVIRRRRRSVSAGE